MTGLEIVLAPADTAQPALPSATPAEFDAYGHTYREEVRRSIAFMGQDLEFFSEVKARYLLEVAERHLGPLSDLTALDVGCGPGLTHKFLVSRFSSVYGVDTSDEMIRLAARANPAASYRCYEGGVLPYRDDTFDVLFAMNVLHHVPMVYRRRFIREMARVTKKTGLVVVFEHNPLNPLTRLAVSRCRFDDHCALVPRAAVLRLLAENGLIPTMSQHILFFPWRGHVFATLDRRLGVVPLGAQYLTAARPVQRSIDSRSD